MARKQSNQNAILAACTSGNFGSMWPTPKEEGIRIRMHADTCYVEGHEPSITLASDTHLCLANGKRFGVGAIPRGSKGRKVSFGPEVAGPWAFAFGLATCLSGDTNVRAQMAAERALDILVANGSILRIDGVQYVVRVVRNEFIELDAR